MLTGSDVYEQGGEGHEEQSHGKKNVFFVQWNLYSCIYKFMFVCLIKYIKEN